MLIRVYVAYLAAARLPYERHGPLADPWLTLVGYFNSMQELAGMRRLCDDDVRSRLLNADARDLGRRLLAEGSVLELTSRVSARDIPQILDRMGLKYPAFEEHKPRRDGPLDVLLATNMISVGVDVSRLGLMVVAGQPKMTSEYIQATSRVGRSAAAPGIVCTVYNWARPHDLSHYERFGHYHETFYRHVEPLSVTPFAPRAIDRGIVALLVALIRLREPRLNADAAAAEPLADDLLGASNSWFAAIRSSLTLPDGRSELDREVERLWEPTLRHVQIPEVLAAFRASGQLETLARFSDADVLAAVARR